MTPLEIIPIGRVLRSFGTRGEMSIETRGSMIADVDPEFVFLTLDGIPVPFRLEDWREKTDDNYIILLHDIDSEEKTHRLIGAEIGLEKSGLPDDIDASVDSLIGFEVLDQQGNSLGRIEDIDTSTANTLLLLDNDLVLPYHDDFLIDINEENQQLLLRLPDGLLDGAEIID